MRQIINRFIEKMGNTAARFAVEEFRQRTFWDAKTIGAAIETQRELDRLRVSVAEKTPGCPLLYGYSVYSQSEEDGIIAHILTALKSHTPLAETFIELGTGNGLENNTHFLLIQGFKGVWVDGNPKNIEFIRNALGGLEFPKFRAQCSRVTLDNIGTILKDAQAFLGSDVDVFSLDLDGNDLYFLRDSLKSIRPKIIIAEYNAKFPPPSRVTIDYDASHAWALDDFYGASLMALVEALAGYRLVSCNLAGTNAFFVRNDLATKFPQYRPEELYQPLRLHLASVKAAGFTPSLKYLAQALKKAEPHGI